MLRPATLELPLSGSQIGRGGGEEGRWRKEKTVAEPGDGGGTAASQQFTMGSGGGGVVSRLG
jgi:hypothetical protein